MIHEHHRDYSAKPTPGGWLYHPYEIALAGFSGSGKTTLAEKLIARLTDSGRSVGFLKHDAHPFDFDKPGKDAHRARAAGAAAVFIADGRHAGLVLDHGPLGADQALLELSFAMHDVLVVEDSYRSEPPKLLLLDPCGAVEEAVSDRTAVEDPRSAGPSAADPFESVRAVLHPTSEAERGRELARCLGGVRALCRDDMDGILALLEHEWLSRRPPLKGLVLAGGASTRMGRDKASIDYRRGVSQARRAAELALAVCGEVVISTRAGQALPKDCVGFSRTHDRFEGFGPMGGILTALSNDPKSAWLVQSCDLPLLERADLEKLITARDRFKVATAFGSTPKLLPEPLCAIYEPKARGRMLATMAHGAVGPRWMLRLGGTKLVRPVNESALFNANEVADYERAVELLDTHPS